MRAEATLIGCLLTATPGVCVFSNQHSAVNLTGPMAGPDDPLALLPDVTDAPDDSEKLTLDWAAWSDAAAFCSPRSAQLGSHTVS